MKSTLLFGALLTLTSCGSPPASSFPSRFPPSPFTVLAQELIETAEALRATPPTRVPTPRKIKPGSEKETLSYFFSQKPAAGPMSWHTVHVLLETSRTKKVGTYATATFSFFLTPKGVRVSTTEFFQRGKPPPPQRLPKGITHLADQLLSESFSGTLPKISTGDIPNDKVLDQHLAKELEITPARKAQETFSDTSKKGSYRLRSLAVLGNDHEGTRFILGGELRASETGSLQWKPAADKSSLAIALFPLQSAETWRSELATVCETARKAKAQTQSPALKSFKGLLDAAALTRETQSLFDGLGEHGTMNYNFVRALAQDHGAPTEWHCRDLETLLTGS